MHKVSLNLELKFPAFFPLRTVGSNLDCVSVHQVPIQLNSLVAVRSFFRVVNANPNRCLPNL